MIRCITAICPAGPPKLSAATLAHTRTASAKVGYVPGASSVAGRAAAMLLNISRHRLGGRPIMGFLGSVSAPSVEGIVEGSPASSCSRSSACMRESPSEAARRPGASGARSGRPVSAPRTILPSARAAPREPEFLDHGIEGAGLAAMAPEDILDIERSRSEPIGDPLTSAGATNKNTAADPRTGGSARDRRYGRSWAAPASPKECGRGCRGPATCLPERATIPLLPRFEAAGEHFGRHPLVTKPGGYPSLSFCPR